MIKIGDYNELTVLKEVDFGVYLDGGEEGGEILLPLRYVPEGLQVDAKIKVFLYTDSEDRLIATTETPKAVVGDFAFLEVIDVNQAGSFLDWGLSKDLLIPRREQAHVLRRGDFCVVRVFFHEETERVAASTKLSKFLGQERVEFKPAQEVSLLIERKTDLGYSAIINGTHLGLLFDNEIFEPIKIGDKIQGYIKRVREDEKIDLSLAVGGYVKVSGISKDIMDKLEAEGGFLGLTDKTHPEIIYSQLKMSKKNFKKAVGALYRERLITIETDGIRLAEKND